MWIKTANGWAPLWTMSAPKLEPVAWGSLTAKWSDHDQDGAYTGELTNLKTARAEFVAEQEEMLAEVRQQRTDRGLL